MHALVAILLLASPAPAAPIELKPFDPVDTSAGKLVRRELPGEESSLRLLLNGDRQLYARDGALELAYLLPQATAAGDDALLAAVRSDVPAEKSCTHYLFVTLPKEGPAVVTPEFGDCSEEFVVKREGAVITVHFTASQKGWAFEDGKLTEVAPPPAKATKGKAKAKATR